MFCCRLGLKIDGRPGRPVAVIGLKGLLLNHEQYRFDTILSKLKENGHKITPQRIAIVKILAKSVGHPSAETIHEQLKSDFPTMSLATMYRNISVIKSLGGVLELGFSDGFNRYDGKTPYPHPHISR